LSMLRWMIMSGLLRCCGAENSGQWSVASETRKAVVSGQWSVVGGQ
jgi:hypothetical protein